MSGDTGNQCRPPYSGRSRDPHVSRHRSRAPSAVSSAGVLGPALPLLPDPSLPSFFQTLVRPERLPVPGRRVLRRWGRTWTSLGRLTGSGGAQRARVSVPPSRPPSSLRPWLLVRSWWRMVTLFCTGETRSQRRRRFSPLRIMGTLSLLSLSGLVTPSRTESRRTRGQTTPALLTGPTTNGSWPAHGRRRVVTHLVSLRDDTEPTVGLTQPTLDPVTYDYLL